MVSKKRLRNQTQGEEEELVNENGKSLQHP